MTFEASIVARFGVSVTKDNPLAVIELDETLNIDAAGTVKNDFDPDDIAWFLVHLDPGLYVAKAPCSDGSVQILQQVTRGRSQDMEFAQVGDEITLPHNPAGAIVPSWYGRDALLKQVGRVLTAQAAPAIGSVAYQITATLCRFIPPKLDLAPEGIHKIKIYVDIEERQ